MSYHRGGHPGAVAVSYSASTMAPLSPSRRYSGSTGSSSGGTYSANSGTTSNYGYISSASSASDRPGSHHRRTFFSPERSSVSSYSESSSIVGSSSNAGSSLRYGSASSSSASSTASSTSSCGRERNGLGGNSSATTVAEIYAKYSVTNYVPNIYSKAGNGHWRPSSSSGFSSSVLAELHGGDEYDSCRERRDRSYSSEGSSGIGLSSNLGSNGSGVVSPGLAERWSTRRESKRRAAPALGSHGVTVLAGHAHLDSAPAPTEVTLIADARNNVPSSSVGHGGESDRRPASAPPKRTVRFDTSTIENHRAKNRDNELDDRDVDNNNAPNDNGNEVDSIVGRESASDLDRRPRRDDRKPGLPAETDENNETDGAYDDLVLIRNNREPNGDYCLNGRSKSSLRKSTIGLDDRRQARPSGTDESRGFNAASNDSSLKSTSSSASSLSSGTACSTDGESVSLTNSRPASSSANALPPNGLTDDERRADVAEDRFGDKLVGGKSSVPNSEESGEEREADRRRTAYAWTKITTNTDNTELLTNNNGHDREADVLGVVERGRIVGRENGEETTRTSGGTSSTPVRRSLLWTASNEVEPTEGNDDDRTEGASRDEADTHETETSGSVNGGDDSGEDEEESNANGTPSGLRNGVVGRPAGTRGDDPGKPSTSRRTAYGWNDPNVDDLTAPTGAASSSASSSAGNSVPVAVHQNLYRGINEQIRSKGSTIIDIGTLVSHCSKLDFVDIINWGLWLAWSIVAVSVVFAFFLGIVAPLKSRASYSPVRYKNRERFVYSLSLVSTDSDTVLRRPSAVKDESSNSRSSRNRLQSRRDERYGLNGLRNIGNTCFMNSVIQCLSNTRPLLEYLLNEQHLQDINTTTSSMKGALIKAFGQVIHELWEMSGDHVVNTTALKSQIQRFAPRFMGYSQQDAQEFLRYLLEGLHEDVNRVTVKPQPILTDIPDHYSDSHKAAESWKRYLRSEDSTIVDVFVGQLRSSLHCTSCDHVSVTLDPFWDLSLPIPVRSGTVKLNQCLEHFTKVETLDGDEKPTCSKCQMRRKCTKSFSIQKFPKILVIHLKRFSPTERFRGKLSVLVDFPLMGLDLSAFAAPGVQGCTYNLYGVANHSGTTYSGHYTAYCKHPYSGDWHEYNDNRVSTVPARSVVSSEAYVLFYEQQPLSPHL